MDNGRVSYYYYSSSSILRLGNNVRIRVCSIGGDTGMSVYV